MQSNGNFYNSNNQSQSNSNFNSRSNMNKNFSNGRNQDFEYVQDRHGQRLNRNRVEKEYPIHNSIQLTINILQKLYANNTDSAVNEKNMDFSDSDFRMLVLKVAGIASKYFFGFKMMLLLYILILLVFARVEIIFGYALLISTLIFAVLFIMPSSIIQLSRQYVAGKKTAKFHKKLLTGWKAFEIPFYLLFLLVVGAYASTNYFPEVEQAISSLSNLAFFKKIGITKIVLMTTIKNLFYSFVVFVVLYNLGNFLAALKGKKLQKVNIRNQIIENRREEVADQLLKGGI